MSRPGVELDFNVHWCPRHLEPFRKGWPAGAGLAMLRLFEACVGDERLRARAPQIEGKAQVSALHALLLEHSPLCCWLGDERMAAIYAEAGKQPPRKAGAHD